MEKKLIGVCVETKRNKILEQKNCINVLQKGSVKVEQGIDERKLMLKVMGKRNETIESDFKVAQVRLAEFNFIFDQIRLLSELKNHLLRPEGVSSKDVERLVFGIKKNLYRKAPVEFLDVSGGSVPCRRSMSIMEIGNSKGYTHSGLSGLSGSLHRTQTVNAFVQGPTDRPGFGYSPSLNFPQVKSRPISGTPGRRSLSPVRKRKPSIEPLQKFDFTIFSKTNDFYKKHIEGPVKLGEQIISKYNGICGLNSELESKCRDS